MPHRQRIGTAQISDIIDSHEMHEMENASGDFAHRAAVTFFTHGFILRFSIYSLKWRSGKQIDRRLQCWTTIPDPEHILHFAALQHKARFETLM